MSVSNVQYLCIGRLSDQLICASYTHTSTTLHTSMDTAIQTLLQSDSCSNFLPDKVYTSPLEGQQWHLSIDDNQLFYLLITERTYPTRVANSCVADLKTDLHAKISLSKFQNAKVHGLDNSCKGIFSKIANKYDNLQEIDSLSKLATKIESVKMTMSENVQMTLKNTEALEVLDEKSEHIKAQAGLFKKQGTQLKQQEWWKACKMKIMFWGLLVVVILVIVLAIWGSTRKKN